MVQALNASQIDYVTFGNHEFDLARDTLLARIEESTFKWISTNCVQPDGTSLPGVLPWDTVRVFGKKIGIFGLTLQGPYPDYVRCGSPDSAAVVALDSLAAMQADIIVAITHQTLAADVALLNREGQLDLILGGHEHEAHSVAVGTRYVLKADANAVSAQFMTIWGTKGEWREAPRLLDVKPNLPADTAVQVVVDRWQDSLRVKLGANYVVGTVLQPIDALDAPQRQQETVLGDLVADAIRLGTGSEIGVINGGAMRLNEIIPPGPALVLHHRVDLPVRRRDPDRHGLGLGAARARSAREQRIGAELRERRLPAGVGHQVHRRSLSRVGRPYRRTGHHFHREHAVPGSGVPAQPPGLSRLPWRRRLQDPGGGRSLRLGGLGTPCRRPGRGPSRPAPWRTHCPPTGPRIIIR